MKFMSPLFILFTRFSRQESEIVLTYLSPEDLSKKDLNNPYNYDDVISHLAPDLQECEIKWALGSTTVNKSSEGDGIPAKLFQILKDDAVKVLHSICQQIWKTQQWPQDWKGQFSFQTQRKAMPKTVQLSHNCTHLLAKQCSKFSKLGFNSM